MPDTGDTKLNKTGSAFKQKHHGSAEWKRGARYHFNVCKRRKRGYGKTEKKTPLREVVENFMEDVRGKPLK